MGGSAFSSILRPTAFPRIPPKAYYALKTRLLAVVSSFYNVVVTPPEAPEKADYGDLDFLVTRPLPPFSSEGTVPHETLKEALKAVHMIPMPGNRTSNYAVPIGVGEWAQFGEADLEARVREGAENREIFYQVDIHVCEDEGELRRINFFHAYGDLGMIMGVMARNVGLLWGQNGLRLVDQPHAPFPLCTNMDQIREFFFPLTAKQHEQGFKTKQEIYEWVIASPMFSLYHFHAQGLGFTKVKPDRKMYHDFTAFVHAKQAEMAQDESVSHGETVPPEPTAERRRRIRDEALTFFGKKEEYEAHVRARGVRVKVKKVFSGHHVAEMAELGTYWLGVKRIMDTVRERLGGDQGALAYAQTHGEEAFREYVVAVRDELGIRSIPADGRDPSPE